jgi:hypothetical protein
MMKGSLIASQPNRTPDVLDSNLMSAYLVGDEAKQMPRIGMIRLDRENLPVSLLGGLQPTGLMVLASNR